MAILKHIASKNADYTETERYLTFQHDENTGKLIRDEDGYPVPRENYLLEGINCDPQTFARECRKVNQQYGKNKRKSEIKTHHYIISFDPKDQELGLTMEQVQQMGMEFARKHFPGHQMVVCTHEDGSNGSGNIHVHIVMNSVRMMDTEPLSYAMRPCDTRAGFKHNCTKPFLKYLQKEVMEMCREQGLNQVDLQHSDRRITNEEYRAGQRGQERKRKTEKQADTAAKPTKFETEKEKLRQAILSIIQDSADTEEFKRKLFEIYGIQVKESRGRWSYLPSGKKKAITGKKLGDAFEKSAVEAVILGTAPITFVQIEQKLKSQKNRQITGTESIGRIVDMEHNAKVKSSAGYEQWAKVHNLQEQAKTFNFLTENGLLDGEKLDVILAEVTADFKQKKAEMKETETRLKEVNRELRLLGQYFSTMNTYRAYCKGGKKKAFKDAHRPDLDLHDAANKELQKIFGNEKFPPVQTLKEEKVALTARKKEQYAAYQEIREQWMELNKISQNRDSFLARQPEKKPVDLG